MSEQTSRPRPVVAPAGEPLTPDDLPPPNLKRSVSRRKAEVVAAVRAGLIGLDEACTRLTASRSKSSCPGSASSTSTACTDWASPACKTIGVRPRARAWPTRSRPAGTGRNQRRIASDVGRIAPCARRLSPWINGRSDPRY